MIHIIFWLYIVSLIITVLSIFSSFLIYKKIEGGWYPYFIKFLLAGGLILLSYTIFFFLFQYTSQSSKLLNELHIYTIFTVTLYFIYVVIILGLTIFNYSLNKKQMIALNILFWTFFIIITITFIFFFNIKIITFYISALSFLLLILILFGFYNRHKFKINTTNKILIYICFISLLLLPLDFIEYFIRKKISPGPTYIPQGIIIISIYNLIINFINLFNNVNLFYKKKIINNNDDYDDAPEKFIKNYSLTDREKEIIEYLVKGYNHKDISEYLHISQRTVERHVYNVYKKCDINTKIDLVNLIREFQ